MKNRYLSQAPTKDEAVEWASVDDEALLPSSGIEDGDEVLVTSDGYVRKRVNGEWVVDTAKPRVYADDAARLARTGFTPEVGELFRVSGGLAYTAVDPTDPAQDDPISSPGVTLAADSDPALEINGQELKLTFPVDDVCFTVLQATNTNTPAGEQVYEWSSTVNSVWTNYFKITDDPAATDALTEILLPSDGTPKTHYIIGAAQNGSGVFWAGGFTTAQRVDLHWDGSTVVATVTQTKFLDDATITSYIGRSYNDITSVAGVGYTVHPDNFLTQKSAGYDDTALTSRIDALEAIHIAGGVASVSPLVAFEDRQLITTTNPTQTGFGISTWRFHLSLDPSQVGTLQGTDISLPLNTPVDLYLVGPSTAGPVSTNNADNNGTTTAVHFRATWDGTDVSYAVVEAIRVHGGPLSIAGEWANRSFDFVDANKTAPFTLDSTDFDQLFTGVVGDVGFSLGPNAIEAGYTLVDGVLESPSTPAPFKNVVPELANVAGNVTGNVITEFTPSESGDYVITYSGDVQSGTGGISVGTTVGGTELFVSDPASGDADGSRLTLTRQENFTPPIPLTAGVTYSITQWVGGSSRVLDHTVFAEVEPDSDVMDASLVTWDQTTGSLLFNTPQVTNGDSSIYDGTIAHNGNLKTFRFALEHDRDQVTVYDFAALVPAGAKIVSAPYPLTDNVAHECPTEVAFTRASDTAISFNRADAIEDVCNYWVELTFEYP